GHGRTYTDHCRATSTRDPTQGRLSNDYLSVCQNLHPLDGRYLTRCGDELLKQHTDLVVAAMLVAC
ncbi:MAG: hypothetical protein M0006_07600, partial [Magnetospirillum sp.]|nr:hypothetical protein [Magnetospirillum sp.]